MFWLAEPTSQTGSELFPVQHRLQNSESPKALCVSTGVYTFRRLISTFKVHMEVMGAFTIIDTTAIVLRAILPLMALSQGTITEFIHFWHFTSIRNGFWGHLVRSMADNTLGRGFSGNAGELLLSYAIISLNWHYLVSFSYRSPYLLRRPYDKQLASVTIYKIQIVHPSWASCETILVKCRYSCLLLMLLPILRLHHKVS